MASIPDTPFHGEIILDEEILAEPSVFLLKRAREACGLSSRDASLYIAGATPRWTEYEHGHRKMTVQRWLLFLLTSELVTPLRVRQAMKSARKASESIKPLNGLTKKTKSVLI